MTTADATATRYDPWYVKVTFGVFVTLVVGLLAVLHADDAARRRRVSGVATSSTRRIIRSLCPISSKIARRAAREAS
jgi:hypothetical protein